MFWGSRWTAVKNVAGDIGKASLSITEISRCLHVHVNDLNVSIRLLYLDTAGNAHHVHGTEESGHLRESTRPRKGETN